MLDMCLPLALIYKYIYFSSSLIGKLQVHCKHVTVRSHFIRADFENHIRTACQAAHGGLYLGALLPK